MLLRLKMEIRNRPLRAAGVILFVGFVLGIVAAQWLG